VIACNYMHRSDREANRSTTAVTHCRGQHVAKCRISKQRVAIRGITAVMHCRRQYVANGVYDKQAESGYQKYRCCYALQEAARSEWSVR
jgi:hypothetical protein